MSLAERIEAYLSAKYTAGLAELTLRNQRSHLTRFAAHLEALHITHETELTREHIEDYMEALSWNPTARGRPMKIETRNVRLASIRSFCRWMLEHDIMAYDPSEHVAYGREPKPLPKTLLSIDEMQKLLAAPDPSTQLGYRDRMVLEVLYSTALRVGELCALNVDDVRLEGGYAMVRRGKGGKDRVVPVGRLACELIENYLADIRTHLLGAVSTHDALILSKDGNRLGPHGVAGIIRRAATKAGLKAKITPHTMRHACATHMLRQGANIRHLQTMLGHTKVSSTEIYTRVTITDLQEVHARYHPRGTQSDVDIRRPKRIERRSPTKKNHVG